MARAATETQKAGLTGPRVRAGDPGHGRGRGVGQRRRARRDTAAVLESATVLLADGTEARAAGAELDFRYRDSRFKHGAGRAGPAEIVLGATFRLAPADPETIKGAPRRDPALAPGAPAARDPVGRERVPQPAGRLGRTADRCGRAQGHADRRRRRVREARQLHRQRPGKGRRPTSAGSPSGSGPRSSTDSASSSRSRSSSSATGPAGRRGARADARAPLGHAPPVAVAVFGGPSAEHDVSIVSGTAIADALSGVGHVVQQVLIDLDGGWWWLPADHRREAGPAAAYDDPAALGATGPCRPATRWTTLAALDPAPVVFIALHGPFGEDGTVQALLEAAGLAYTGSGVAASAIGMDKAIFKRLGRGLGLPVVDWREVRAARWAADPAGVLGGARGVRRRDRRRPRLMVKPARLGSSVGMTLAHGPAERAARSTRRSATTTSRWSSATSPAPATSRSRSSATTRTRSSCTGRARSSPATSSTTTPAKYTPGLSETSTLTAEVTPAERAAILKLARDAYRAVGAEGFARIDFLLAGRRHLPVRDQHDPGLHADQPVPDAAGRGRATTSPPCAGASSTSPSSATPAASATASPRPTCRDEPIAGRSRRRDPARRGRAGASAGGRIRRASAGLSPVPGRRAPGDARLGRRDLRGRCVVGAPSSTAAPWSTGATWTSPDRRSPRRSRSLAARTCSGSRPARSGRR